MSLLIVCGLFLVWYFGLIVIKQLASDHKTRWEDRVMADYLKAEDARAHRWLLEDVEKCRRSTQEELIRAAQLASGEIVEGTAVETQRR
jgi:hypothetical protein